MKEVEKAEAILLVKNFYTWSIANRDNLEKFEPKIVDSKDKHEFFLNTSTLSKYSSLFISSGYFAESFGDRLRSYYIKYEKEFSNYKKKDFEELYRIGRGPLMEVENMDIYFCAQEYEYKPEFVDAMELKSISNKEGELVAVVKSPYEWETTFKFTRNHGKLVISGYCVFQ